MQGPLVAWRIANYRSGGYNRDAKEGRLRIFVDTSIILDAIG
jgi:hypothetical protein